jgi:hypothetical protein
MSLPKHSTHRTISSARASRRSVWREWEFMLWVVQTTILPRIALRDVLQAWSHIAESLAEPSRRRTLQTEALLS